MTQRGKYRNQVYDIDEVYKISAKIFSLTEGEENYDDIRAVRIESKDYNILVMEDYLPVIGAIDGSITLLCREFEKKFENIVGYYKHSHNQFSLIIKEVKKKPAKAAAAKPAETAKVESDDKAVKEKEK